VVVVEVVVVTVPVALGRGEAWVKGFRC